MADISTLVRTEIELAKAEVGKSAKKAGIGAGLRRAGVVSRTPGFFFGIAFAEFLTWLGLERWISYVIVWGVLVVSPRGRADRPSAIKKIEKPERTIETLPSCPRSCTARLRGAAPGVPEVSNGGVAGGAPRPTGVSRGDRPGGGSRTRPACCCPARGPTASISANGIRLARGRGRGRARWSCCCTGSRSSGGPGATSSPSLADAGFRVVAPSTCAATARATSRPAATTCPTRPPTSPRWSGPSASATRWSSGTTGAGWSAGRWPRCYPQASYAGWPSSRWRTRCGCARDAPTPRPAPGVRLRPRGSRCPACPSACSTRDDDYPVGELLRPGPARSGADGGLRRGRGSVRPAARIPPAATARWSTSAGPAGRSCARRPALRPAHVGADRRARRCNCTASSTLRAAPHRPRLGPVRRRRLRVARAPRHGPLPAGGTPRPSARRSSAGPRSSVGPTRRGRCRPRRSRRGPRRRRHHLGAVSAKPVFGSSMAEANTTPSTLPSVASSGPPELPARTIP